ncbi:riboflavin biosynthesis protein RibF, partial [bacterium]|nr:riboflavin biosynthesis protein RibF [bacterium]
MVRTGVVMRLFRELEDVNGLELPSPRIMTAGVFDGLHRAHCTLVRGVVEKARSETSGSSMVFTFSNHPLSVLAPAYQPKKLLSSERKAQLLNLTGLDVLIMPEFTARLAALDPDAFIQEVLVGRFRVDHLVVGFDFRFGSQGCGDADLLVRRGRELGFEVEVLPAVYEQEWPVSSTRIRELVEEGRVRLAADMLGRPYELEGPVVHGHGRGTGLGYPTANLLFDPAFATPASGVYAVLASIDGRIHPAMMNLGSSPTFQGTEYRPEVFLFDYAGESLYDNRLRVYFIERLREE